MIRKIVQDTKTGTRYEIREGRTLLWSAFVKDGLRTQRQREAVAREQEREALRLANH